MLRFGIVKSGVVVSPRPTDVHVFTKSSSGTWSSTLFSTKHKGVLQGTLDAIFKSMEEVMPEQIILTQEHIMLDKRFANFVAQYERSL